MELELLRFFVNSFALLVLTEPSRIVNPPPPPPTRTIISLPKMTKRKQRRFF